MMVYGMRVFAAVAVVGVDGVQVGSQTLVDSQRDVLKDGLRQRNLANVDVLRISSAPIRTTVPSQSDEVTAPLLGKVVGTLVQERPPVPATPSDIYFASFNCGGLEKMS